MDLNTNPMLSISVKVLTTLGILFPTDPRIVFVLIPIFLRLILQICYLVFADDELEQLALNIFSMGLSADCLVIVKVINSSSDR